MGTRSCLSPTPTAPCLTCRLETSPRARLLSLLVPVRETKLHPVELWSWGERATPRPQFNRMKLCDVKEPTQHSTPSYYLSC